MLRKCGAGSVLALLATVGLAYGCSDDTTDEGSEIENPDPSGGEGGGSGSTSHAGHGGEQPDASPFIDVARGGEGGEPNCGTETMQATHRQVNVLLVIDKSASMDDTPDGFDTDKWTAIQSALDEALTATQIHLWYGVMVFPDSTGDDACETATGATAIRVEVAEGEDSVPDILDELATITPSGGTPTATALQAAYDYFTEGEGADLDGDKVVLLATDGGPNCTDNEELTCDADACTQNLDGLCPVEAQPGLNCCEAFPGECLDDDRTVEEIEQLAQDGITTFVVGIPGSEVYGDVLDRMAQAGEATNPDSPPDYFEVSADGGVEGLAEVLVDITRELITSCDLQITELPPEWDPGLVNVNLDGENVQWREDREAAEAAEDGWWWPPEADPPTIQLLGTTCDQVESEGVESVEIVFGCPTRPPE